MRDLALIALTFFACSGCCTYWHDHPVITSRTGQKLCARHHIPLVTVHGYGTLDYAPGPRDIYQNRVITLIHTWGLQAQREKCNPNYIPRGQSLQRTKDQPVPILVTYCPKCEDATWLTEKEARQMFRKP
jgi:hypothetical protein